jgi:AraC-like DNA-binding protein
MRSVLSAAHELSACQDTTSMLRLATEAARERLGLERVGLYIRDRSTDRIILRGTWGTGAHGETTDERASFHEIGSHDYEALLDARRVGGLGMYQAHAPLVANDAGQTRVVGNGWIMATPLVAARDLVGVMYNDSAFTHEPVDEGKQALTAVFCTVLAVILVARRGTIEWQPLPRQSGRSPLVRRILRALDDELPITGERLARELNVSAGYLARSFKREMAISLVDYRNRVRLGRFFETLQRKGGGSLVDAALEAGFGSYAQFHRVYRKFQGGSPRDLIAPPPDTTDP